MDQYFNVYFHWVLQTGSPRMTLFELPRAPVCCWELVDSSWPHVPLLPRAFCLNCSHMSILHHFQSGPLDSPCRVCRHAWFCPWLNRIWFHWNLWPGTTCLHPLAQGHWKHKHNADSNIHTESNTMKICKWLLLHIKVRYCRKDVNNFLIANVKLFVWQLES